MASRVAQSLIWGFRATSLAAASKLTDPAAHEQELSTLIVDIAKLKQDAALAKGKSDELVQTRQRVKALKDQIDTGLGEIKPVLESIKEPTLRQPSAQALERLNVDLKAATLWHRRAPLERSPG